ncbi:type IV pilus assembly protein PilC [Neisseria gonorrhoeae]|nr:type IV pilus assembly protein PilC [Neisseria gonorrhoeae]
MNKTLKRQVFRHTALYAAILMFSHTGGGGGGGRRKPVTTLLS